MITGTAPIPSMCRSIILLLYDITKSTASADSANPACWLRDIGIEPILRRDMSPIRCLTFHPQYIGQFPVMPKDHTQQGGVSSEIDLLHTIISNVLLLHNIYIETCYLSALRSTYGPWLLTQTLYQGFCQSLLGYTRLQHMLVFYALFTPLIQKL